MYQCRSISCDKYTIVVGNVDDGGAVHRWGQGVYGKSFPLSFAVNLKLLQKVLIKNK